MNILKMNNLKTKERKKDKMVSIEYVHKLLELYNQLCSPLCQQTGISQTSLDILMFLKNNPQYKNAADIVKSRQIWYLSMWNDWCRKDTLSVRRCRETGERQS